MSGPRRFVRTYTVRRVAQFTVIDDRETRQFEVWSWLSANKGIAQHEAFPYGACGADQMRPVALTFARDLADRARVEASAAALGEPDGGDADVVPA